MNLNALSETTLSTSRRTLLQCFFCSVSLYSTIPSLLFWEVVFLKWVGLRGNIITLFIIVQTNDWVFFFSPFFLTFSAFLFFLSFSLALPFV